MLQQPHILQAQAFPAQGVESMLQYFINRSSNLIQVSAVLALPLCPTMLPCSMMNHTRTWVL